MCVIIRSVENKARFETSSSLNFAFLLKSLRSLPLFPILYTNIYLSFGCISYEFAYCVWLAVLLRFLISGRGFVCFGLPLFLPAIVWLRSFALLVKTGVWLPIRSLHEEWLRRCDNRLVTGAIIFVWRAVRVCICLVTIFCRCLLCCFCNIC